MISVTVVQCILLFSKNYFTEGMGCAGRHTQCEIHTPSLRFGLHQYMQSQNLEWWFDCLCSKEKTSFDMKTADQYDLEQQFPNSSSARETS